MYVVHSQFQDDRAFREDLVSWQAYIARSSSWVFMPLSESDSCVVEYLKLVLEPGIVHFISAELFFRYASDATLEDEPLTQAGLMVALAAEHSDPIELTTQVL